MIKNYNINHQIKANNVDIAGSEGMKNNVSLFEAIKMAENEGLDLVEVSNNAKENPVCKIMDYGKMIYNQNKKQKNNKSCSHRLKEIKYSFNISSHDLETKHKKIIKFLEKDYTVRYVLELKGREKNQIKEAIEEMNNNLLYFSQKATWSSPKVSYGRKGSISTVLNPL